MSLMRRPKHVFTAISFAVAILIGALIPFFSKVVKEIPAISLSLGQVALVFLFTLAAFPRASYKQIIKLSINYLVFIGACFALLSFMPFPAETKLFAFNANASSFNSAVAVNLVCFLFLNLVSFIFMNLGFYVYPDSKTKDSSNIEETETVPVEEPMAISPETNFSQELLHMQEQQYEESFAESTIEQPMNQQPSYYEEAPMHYEAPAQSYAPENNMAATENLEGMINSQTFIEDPFENLAQTQSKVQQGKQYIDELKNEVESLFSLYVTEDDEESRGHDQNEKLEILENTLLNNLDLNVQEALCVDKDGNILEDTVFHWNSVPKEQLLRIFNEHKEFCKNLRTGKLCQLLINDSGSWFMIARYRGNYLILKTAAPDPLPLLNTSFKVFKAV